MGIFGSRPALRQMEPGTTKNKSFFQKLKSKTSVALGFEWDPQITTDDCVPFEVFLGAVLSRAAYDPPTLFALDIDETYSSIFQHLSLVKSDTSQCRDVGKQPTYSLYLNTRKVAEDVNNEFVRIERHLQTPTTGGAKTRGRTNSKKQRRTRKKSRRYKGGASILPEKYYHFDTLNSQRKAILQKNQNWAFMYIHTSDDLSCYIIADKTTNGVYVIFRGTRSMQNIRADLKPTAHILCSTSNQKTHEEVFKGIFKLESEALHTIYYCSLYIAELFLKASPTKPAQLYTFGHSLGGANATLYAYLWVGIHDEQKRIGNQHANALGNSVICCSYGSPKIFNSVLNNHFEKLVTSGRIHFIRSFTAGDIITSLPPEAKVKVGRVNLTLMHAGKTLAVPIQVDGKTKMSNYTLLKCKNTLGTVSAARHLAGTLVKKNKANLKGVNLDYSKPLRCTTINYNPKKDITLHAHAIQVRIEFFSTLSGFKAGSELESGRTRSEKITNVGNVICKVFYAIPGTLTIHAHTFHLSELQYPGAKTDNKVNSYEEFKRLIGTPLMKNKNNKAAILQSGLGGKNAINKTSQSTKERIDAGETPIKLGKVKEHIQGAHGFDKLTCETPV